MATVAKLQTEIDRLEAQRAQVSSVDAAIERLGVTAADVRAVSAGLPPQFSLNSFDEAVIAANAKRLGWNPSTSFGAFFSANSSKLLGSDTQKSNLGLITGREASTFIRQGGDAGDDINRQKTALRNAQQDVREREGGFQLSRDNAPLTASQQQAQQNLGQNPVQTPGGNNVTTSSDPMVRVRFSDGSESTMPRSQAEQLAQGEDIEIFPVSGGPTGGGGDLGIGGDQDIGLGGGGNAQVGDPPPLTAQEIFDAFAGGGDRADAEEALLNLGGVWTPERVAQMLDSIEAQAPHAAVEGTAQTPTATPTVLGEPEDFVDILSNIGLSDVSRGFAVRSGVNPDFRDLVQRRAEGQLLPFALQQARNFSGGTGERLTDQFTTQKFQDFLGNRTGGFQSLGGSLRDASSFLRIPSGDEGDFSDPQQVIRGQLLNLAGEGQDPNIGSDLFSKLISAARSRGTGGRTIPGINVGRAVGSSLENVFARDPNRFGQSAPNFIDFLTKRGLI